MERANPFEALTVDHGQASELRPLFGDADDASRGLELGRCQATARDPDHLTCAARKRPFSAHGLDAASAIRHEGVKVSLPPSQRIKAREHVV